MGRIMAEYGANILKVTGSNMGDVPFFRIDGSMDKSATEINLKSEEGK